MVIGKTDSGYLQKGIDEYSGRIGHYINFEIRTLPYSKNNRNGDDLANRDVLKVLSNQGQGREIILLDEKGKELTSKEFSAFLEKKMLSGLKELVFFIGGPFGFTEEVRDLAGTRLSLSKMTFSHQMVRLLFVEQLYRAFTILRGESYHHE